MYVAVHENPWWSSVPETLNTPPKITWVTISDTVVVIKKNYENFLVLPDAASDVHGVNGQSEGEHVHSSKSFLNFKFDCEAIMKSCFDS